MAELALSSRIVQALREPEIAFLILAEGTMPAQVASFEDTLARVTALMGERRVALARERATTAAIASARQQLRAEVHRVQGRAKRRFRAWRHAMRRKVFIGTRVRTDPVLLRVASLLVAWQEDDAWSWQSHAGAVALAEARARFAALLDERHVVAEQSTTICAKLAEEIRCLREQRRRLQHTADIVWLPRVPAANAMRMRFGLHPNKALG